MKSSCNVQGRKPGLTDEAKTKAWASYHLHQQEDLSVQDILKQLNVSKATFYRYIDWAKNNMDQKPKKRKSR